MSGGLGSASSPPTGRAAVVLTGGVGSLAQERTRTYDSSVDMWALGVTAYMLLAGKRPFDHAEREKKIAAIRRAEPDFSRGAWRELSADAADFCARLLQKAPDQRLSAKQALRHPWIEATLGEGVPPSFSAKEEPVSPGLVQSLQAIRGVDLLTRLTLEVVSFGVAPANLRNERIAFMRMDADGSGLVLSLIHI